MDVLGVYAGTPIEWLPEWIVSIWRFIFFVANVHVLVKFATMTFTRNSPKVRLKDHFTASSFMWIWLGCVVFLLRSLIIQVERFGDKAVYEGLLMQTIVLLCIWRGVYLYRKGC